MDLKLGAARTAIQTLAKEEEHAPVERLAQYVSEAVEDSLATAARAHAAEHGLELHRHVLVAYGGAAPLRAAHLAERLRIRTVLIPPDASVGSAIGFFSAPLAFEALESCRMKLSAFDHSQVNAIFRQLWHRTSEQAPILGIFVISSPSPHLLIRHKRIRYHAYVYIYIRVCMSLCNSWAFRTIISRSMLFFP